MSITKQTHAVALCAKRRKISHDLEADAMIEQPLDSASTGSESDRDAEPADRASSSRTRNDAKSQTTAARDIRQGITSLDKSASSTSFDQILGGSRDRNAITDAIQKDLDSIMHLVREIPASTSLPLGQVETRLMQRSQTSVPYPSPHPSQDSNLKFRFQRQGSVESNESSWLDQDSEGPLAVSITVRMPDSALQEKDYQNLRAFHKRALYLACIAAHLRGKVSKDFDLHYGLCDGVALLPILKLVPKRESDISHSFVFTLNVIFPDNVFPKDKLSPGRNCVRPNISSSQDDIQPTPYYNSCLLSNTSTDRLEQFISKKLKDCPALRDAAAISRVWLQRRGLSSNLTAGGFGIAEWSLICALLLESGGQRGHSLFSNRYSYIQLFKAMLQVLASRDLTEPWVVRGSSNISPSDLPVFFDDEFGFNIMYKVSSASYQALRQHAQLSLTALNSKNEENADQLSSVYVAAPRLHNDEIFTVTLGMPSSLDACNQLEHLQTFHRIFQQGLGDRVESLGLRLPYSASWSIEKQLSDNLPPVTKVELLLRVNPETVSRLVDHGPSADEKEAAAGFQNFWGHKAELRRFKDGSISESLVWSDTEPVTLQIIRHLATLHFSSPPSSITSRVTKLEQNLFPASTKMPIVDAFKAISSQYQSLTTTLHQLNGLPLPIRSISPADAALRSTTITTPLEPSTSSPINVLIQFDSSTRWPDSLPAIQYTKIAFLTKLSDLLSDQDHSLTTRVGLENTTSAHSGHLNTSFLDVIYPSQSTGLSPICFRLRIHHDHELHLIQSALADKSLHGSVRDQLSSALAIHKRDFLAAPAHTAAIRNLVTKFAPFSTTIRLLKRWGSSHLLSRLIPSEVLEIIAAKVFLDPLPWAVPGSATTAFFRCLYVLSMWKWQIQPLIVDLSLSQDMTLNQREEFRTRFQAWRKLDPNMNQVAWFLGTNVDESGVVWTGQGRVEKVVASRIQALAKASIDVVVSKGIEMDEADEKSLFLTPMQDFDFQLHLSKAVVRKSGREKGRQNGFKNLEVLTEAEEERIGFEPVELYLRELEKGFGNVALFFHDGYGGKVIAGLWRPGVLSGKEWRVRMGWSTKPVVDEGDEGKVMGEFNKEAVLSEMKMLGEGIVRSVTAKGS